MMWYLLWYGLFVFACLGIIDCVCDTGKTVINTVVYKMIDSIQFHCTCYIPFRLFINYVVLTS